jgi:hypothetical protein
MTLSVWLDWLLEGYYKRKEQLELEDEIKKLEWKPK